MIPFPQPSSTATSFSGSSGLCPLQKLLGSNRRLGLLSQNFWGVPWKVTLPYDDTSTCMSLTFHPVVSLHRPLCFACAFVSWRYFLASNTFLVAVRQTVNSLYFYFASMCSCEFIHYATLTWFFPGPSTSFTITGICQTCHTGTSMAPRLNYLFYSSVVSEYVRRLVIMLIYPTYRSVYGRTYLLSPTSSLKIPTSFLKHTHSTKLLKENGWRI
jgi:hypothetical protein